MKRAFLFLVAIGLGACSRSPRKPESDAASTSASLSSLPEKVVDVKTTGLPYGLRAEGSAVTFCDSRGGRKLELLTGEDTPFMRACTRDGEANIACGGLGLDVTVSTPGLGPDDVLDAPGRRYPLKGRAHDCAAEGGVLGIVTGSTVLLIDTTRAKVEVIDESQGGDRIVLGPGWLAWTADGSVHVRNR